MIAIISNRIRVATRAAALHVVCSVIVALAAAYLVLELWYPFPFNQMSGGRELFFLVISIDVICGPLLTLVIFNPTKPRRELWRDLGLVVLIQFGAMGYGLWTVWQARPLYLVCEIDRFKVIRLLDLENHSLEILPVELQPNPWKGPQTVAIRSPKDREERHKVMIESVLGGADYAERPEFYLPYNGESARKSLKFAKPLGIFLNKYPEQEKSLNELLSRTNTTLEAMQYLPIRARQDWIAVIDADGKVTGYLKGDGF